MKRLLISVLFLVATLMVTDGQSVRDQVVHSYTNELGVREATGSNDGADVEKYLASAGFGKGYAWCAAFVNWVHESNGIDGPRGPAWSPSWFPDSKVYDRHERPPQPGDVFGIYFKSKQRIAHVGFIDKWDGSKVITVEGNTNEAGSREGDGVYRKRRLARQIYKLSNWIDDAEGT